MLMYRLPPCPLMVLLTDAFAMNAVTAIYYSVDADFRYLSVLFVAAVTLVIASPNIFYPFFSQIAIDRFAIC